MRKTITNFCFIYDKFKEIKLNIGCDVDIFSNVDEAEKIKYFNSKSKGIKWIYNEKELFIFEEGFSLFGFPSVSLQKIIVIYRLNNYKFPEPQNAVIYDLDGNINMQLVPPTLISDMAKQRAGRNGYYEPSNMYFMGTGWSKDSKGNIVNSISIGFDWEYWESRVLDAETGEFGECLGSGRR